LLEYYQKLEEKRLDQMQSSLTAYLQKDSTLWTTRGKNIPQRTENVGHISKEAEIKKIIETYEIPNDKIEEIPYHKADSKNEKMIQKFDSHYTKGAPVKDFDVEKTYVSISTGASEEEDQSVQVVVSGLKKLLSNCWEGKLMNAQEKELATQYTKDAKGRKILADSVNYYRKCGQFSMKEKGYRAVTELLFQALDQAQMNDDIDFALNTMVLAQTFFLEQPNPSGGVIKAFLVLGIQKHPIWNVPGFWTKAINSAIKEELTTQHTQGLSEDERMMIERNIAFGKLSTVAHNMVQFAVDRAEIEKVVLTYAKEKTLPEPFINALKVLIIH
jgi:hypothetical protein